jgi:hypothetical protein
MSYGDRFERVRAILLRDWDPLVVGENPHLSDEYDDFIPGILRLLDDHCTAEELEEHLAAIDAELGGTPSWPNIARAVPKLLALGGEA